MPYRDYNAYTVPSPYDKWASSPQVTLQWEITALARTEMPELVEALNPVAEALLGNLALAENPEDRRLRLPDLQDREPLIRGLPHTTAFHALLDGFVKVKTGNQSFVASVTDPNEFFNTTTPEANYLYVHFVAGNRQRRHDVSPAHYAPVVASVTRRDSLNPEEYVYLGTPKPKRR